MSIEDTYDTYVGAVYKFFYIKSFNKQTAEDLTSQTFMVLVEKAGDPDYVIQDSKKFVYGVMRNIWLAYLRDKYHRSEQAWEDIEDFEDYADEEIENYGAMSAKERAELFINKLPERQRDIVAMRLLEELSIKDICRVSGHDSNYVKTTYKRGMKNLRSMVAAAGQQEILTRQTLGKEAI